MQNHVLYDKNDGFNDVYQGKIQFSQKVKTSFNEW